MNNLTSSNIVSPSITQSNRFTNTLIFNEIYILVYVTLVVVRCAWVEYQAIDMVDWLCNATNEKSPTFSSSPLSATFACLDFIWPCAKSYCFFGNISWSVQAYCSNNIWICSLWYIASIFLFVFAFELCTKCTHYSGWSWCLYLT